MCVCGGSGQEVGHANLTPTHALAHIHTYLVPVSCLSLMLTSSCLLPLTHSQASLAPPPHTRPYASCPFPPLPPQVCSSGSSTIRLWILPQPGGARPAGNDAEAMGGGGGMVRALSRGGGGWN